jgi:CYTH domain-containing protein
MERERKFLVKKLPPDRSRHSHALIEQGYLAIIGKDGAGSEVRLRRTRRRFTLTVKRGHGESRWETESPLASPMARLLWPLTRGLRVSKVRYEIPYGALTIELDVYRGVARGLAVAEIEFPSDRALRRFVAPDWFGREITGRKEYANSQIALTQRRPRLPR